MTCWHCKQPNTLADHCCLWCFKPVCQDDHRQEMFLYRQELQQRVEFSITIWKRYNIMLPVNKPATIKLFAGVNPNEMTMEDHWMKGLIKDNLAKGLSDVEAYEKAKQKVSRIQYRNRIRNSNLYVSLTKKDRAEIQKRSKRWKTHLSPQEQRANRLLKRYGY